MKYLFSYLFLFTALFINQACNDPSQNGTVPEPQLVMETQQTSPTTTFHGDTLVFQRYNFGAIAGPDQPYPDFNARLEGDKIVIDGFYYAHSGGYIPEGEIRSIDGNVVNVRIGGVPENSGAITAMPQPWLYTAYIEDLSPGSYTVDIVHRNDFARSELGKNAPVYSGSFTIE